MSPIYLAKFEELIIRKIRLDNQKNPIFKEVFLNKNLKDKALDINQKPILIPEYEESLDQYNARIDAFFNGLFSEHEKKEGWTQNKVFDFIVIFEKIIREFVPIIPIMEVDTYWIINRIRAGDSNSFQFAFDVENIKVNYLSPDDGKE
ncbi:hypothetical protein B5C39_02230 [Mesomycoplasma hyopneumoniae]|nr:hypothetical protein B5C39_02230 [Mesomycoplasma hyopneumoniae]